MPNPRAPRLPVIPVLLFCSFLALPAWAQVGRSGLVNPNLASQAELAGLPGVSQNLAKSIVEARPFLRMSSLQRIVQSSLDPEQAEALYRRLWLPIDLNDASRAEILLIPGVGDRMAHEFEEYRPYKALAQFRREIGKYVDDEEVERLSGYVFVQIDLNTASREDILSIPGVGNRMAHEFEEYRPYKAMAQFRREIGKYVDEEEVARLERYVQLTP